MIKKILIHVLYGVISTTLTSAGCGNNDPCNDAHMVDVYPSYSSTALANATCNPSNVPLCNTNNWSLSEFDEGPNIYMGLCSSGIDECSNGSNFRWNANTVFSGSSNLGNCYARFRVHDSRESKVTITVLSSCSLCIPGNRSSWRGSRTMRNGVTGSTLDMNLNYEPNNLNNTGC